MADELKRYEPTPRRLQKLREAGVLPGGEALAAAAVLVACGVAGALGGEGLIRALGALLAQDLAQVQRPVEALVPLLAQRLGAAALLVAALAATGVGIALLVQWALGNVQQRSSKSLYLPMSGAKHPRPRGTPAWSWLLGAVGGVCGAALLAGWLHRLAAATQWPGVEQAAQARWLGLWWLGVLTLLAAFHTAAAWLRHRQQARMSHREMQEERRESEGSWLKRRPFSSTQYRRRARGRSATPDG